MTIIRQTLYTAVLLMLASSPVFAGKGPPVEIGEFFDGFNGFYAVTNDSCCSSIIGFAVENDTASGVDTTRPDWIADLVGEDAWNEGYPFGPDSEFNTADFDLTFDDIFGEDAFQAAFYFVGDLEGVFLFDAGIQPGESDNRFTFEAFAPASGFVAFFLDPNGNVNFNLGQTHPIPEPVSALLLGGGLLGLALKRRHRA
jgi:hypothetical protein